MAKKVQGAFDRKVVGGKLVRVRLEMEAGEMPRLHSVRVYGDFFMHPETLIEDIEKVLLEDGLDTERARTGLKTLFDRPDVSVFGAGPEDFLATFNGALEDARSVIGPGAYGIERSR